MANEELKQGTEGGGADRTVGLKARIDALANLNRQIAESRVAMGRTRIGIVIVILLVMLGFGAVIYSMVRNFDTTTFLAETRYRMLNPNVGTFADFVQMAQRVLPVYQKEVEDQFAKDWPVIQAKLKTEGETLVKNVTAKAEDKLKAKLGQMAERQRANVMKEFPELTDAKSQDIVMKNLEKALQGAVVDVLQARVAKAEERLLNVHQKVVQFLPKESRDTFQERWSKVWEQFLLYDMKGARLITR